MQNLMWKPTTLWEQQEPNGNGLGFIFIGLNYFFKQPNGNNSKRAVGAMKVNAPLTDISRKTIENKPQMWYCEGGMCEESGRGHKKSEE